MIDKVSGIIAVKLKEKYNSEMPSISIIKYAIKFLITNGLSIAAILLISLILNNFYDVLIVLVGFSGLRIISGGAHIKKPELCVSVSIVLILLIAYIGTYITSSVIINILNLFSLLLIIIFAPSNITGFTRIKENKYIMLKVISIIIIIISFFMNNPFFTIATFSQSLTLISLKGGEKK